MKHVADERCGREDWPRRHLAHSHGIEELGLGQPVTVVHQVGAQEREEDVATPKEHGAHLEKDREEPQQARGCDRCGSRRGRAAERREHGDSYAAQSSAFGDSLGNHRQCASGDQDRERVDTGEAGDHGAERDRAQHQGLHCGAPESQESLQDDGNDHWFDSVEKGGDLWQRSEMYVSPCAAENDQRGRKDEACSTKEKAGPACAPVTNEDCQLGRAWTGDEVRRAEKVEEFLSGEPRPSTDHLLLHHRDVSRWTAKGSQTQAQKEEHHVAHRAPSRARGRRLFSHAWSCSCESGGRRWTMSLLRR